MTRFPAMIRFPALSRATLIVVAAAALAAAYGGPTMAAPIKNATWLWSSQSNLVTNSTAALAVGRTGRAIALAKKALEKVDGGDRMIALHNLCLAWLTRGELATAEPYCTEAVVAAAGGEQIAVSPRSAATVLANVELARRQADAERAVRMAQSAAQD